MQRNFFRVITDKRHRMIVATSAVFVILVLTILSYQLYRGFENETRKAQIITKNTAYILEEHIEGVFKNVDLMLTNVVDIINIRGKRYKWTPAKYQELLHEKAESVPALLIVKIANSEGKYIGQAEKGTMPTTSIFDRSYFQTHLHNPKSGLVISEPLMARSSKVPVMTVSRRISDEAGKFLGIVNASLPISYFQNIFSKIDIGPHGNITMVTLKERAMVTRFPVTAAAQVGQPFKSSPPMEKILSSDLDEGTWYAKSGIDPYIKTFSLAKNQQYDFFVTNGLAEVDYLASWRTNLYWSFGSFVILLIGFLLGLYSFLISTEKIERQKLQVAESAKMSTLGGMAAGIAHEINNPLAIIQSKTEAIKMALDAQPANIVQIHAMLTSIDRTVYRIAKIINSLRVFTRQTENDQKAESALDQIVNDSTALIYEKFKSAAITLKVAPVPQSIIQCHEAQLVEVLFCLLTNSHDALVLQKESRWVDIKFVESKSKLQIIITDSGTGIPTSIANKIMDPFFTTKPIGQGAGLGLSTSKGIIESHSGKLILNKYSKNTQFIIELPATMFQLLKQA